MRYLITGGAGFIGSHLAEVLVKKGEEVYVIDDLSTGSLINVLNFLEKPNFHLVIDTILNQTIVEQLVKKVDFVFHLAAVVGVKKVMKSAIQSIIVNIEGTYNILKSCSENNKKILITSTSEVYGKNEKIPFSEDEDIIIGSPKKKRWSYACTKAIDEFLSLAFYQEKNLPVIIVRLFNTVGPRQSERYGMVIPRFVKQALRGKPITVFGTGNQTRCFIHVKDVVNALLNLIQRKESFGEIFNIGSTEEITINELAHLVKKLSGSNSKIVHIQPETIYSSG
ncbi:NAD-dependent epimerase/dehydratase family protein, partial [bacterium]|nr:NAD-dependent epimerase/dehydratase family protein [bacterium]